jgi:hypothetical protein
MRASRGDIKPELDDDNPCVRRRERGDAREPTTKETPPPPLTTDD